MIDLVEVLPAQRLAFYRPLQRCQPAPPFTHLNIGVVEGGRIDLEEALGAPFHVHQGAIGLGKTGRWQHQICLVGGRGRLMVDDQQVLQPCQRSIHPVARRAAVEIVLQGDQRQPLFGLDTRKGGFERLV